MKALLISSLFFSALSFAQSNDLSAVKRLMTERASLLEKATPGMSKQVITRDSFITERGEECSYALTSTQTILRILGERLVVFSHESFRPASTPACQAIGAEAYEERVLFYQDKPSLQASLAALEMSAQDLVSVQRSGDIVTLSLRLSAPQEDGTTVTDNVTVKYDLSKSAFKHLILNQGSGYSVTTSEHPDRDPQGFDLSDVLFCDSEESDRAECVPGNYSDILY